MDAVLPGEDLIEAGLRDLREGRETVEALLVAIGSPRLRRLGLELPEQLPHNPEPAFTTCLLKTTRILHIRATTLLLEDLSATNGPLNA